MQTACATPGHSERSVPVITPLLQALEKVKCTRVQQGTRVSGERQDAEMHTL